MLTMVMNVIMDFIFIKYLGLAGITLSTSVASIICIFLLFISLKKKVGYFGQDKILKTTGKAAVAATIMGVVVYELYYWMMKMPWFDGDACLFGVVIIGASLYGGLVMLFKVEEIRIVTDVVKRRLKKKS